MAFHSQVVVVVEVVVVVDLLRVERKRSSFRRMKLRG